MLSTAFIQKKLFLADPSKQQNKRNEQITQISWNKTDGWLAYAGENGTLKVVMIESVDSHDFNLQGVAARPSRISIEKFVEVHVGNRITALNWNENQEQITSGDQRGQVVVCEYKDSKWSSILVNESVLSPCVNAMWASDGSKILIFYQSGQVLLGAASGHKILAVQIKQPEPAKFAFVSDSRWDFFVVGFETKIVGYNFDSTEKFRIQLGKDEKIMSGTLVEYKSKEDPKVVTITMTGTIYVHSCITGYQIAKQEVQIVPSQIVVSPNTQYLAVAGSLLENTKSNDPEQNAEFLAVVKLIRLADLENVATLKIPAQKATCVSWDASSLRLAVGTDSFVFLCALRLSYRQYMLRDGTVAFSLGSSIIKQSSQLIKQSQKDECIMFFKNTVHKRWPQNFIDQCACGEYLAMCLGRVVQRQDGSQRQLSSIVFHSSVGAPVITLDLTFVPMFMSGCSHYLVVANQFRISLFDIRFLSGETKDYANSFETKLDAGQTYNGIIEWHADSTPFAPDRELHVVKTVVSSPVASVSCSNSALFLARENGNIVRFNLPSLQSNVKIQATQMKVIKTNCSGTAVAGVTNDGALQIYYADDFVESEQTEVQKEQQKEKKEEKVLKQQEVADDLQKMLGYDTDVKIDRQQKQVLQKDVVQKKQLAPWETKIEDVWGIEWNQDDPNLLAVSSQHYIYILQIDKRRREDPITSSAHLLNFKGLKIHGVYLDEIVTYGDTKEGSIRVIETQQLRELKNILFGGQQEEDVEQDKQMNLITLFTQETADTPMQVNTNIQQAINYLKQQNATHPHLFKMVAEAALKELALDIASTYFIRAGDYISYHFTEHIRKIGQDELRRAEVAVFLGDFRTAEQILIKQLGRPEIATKNDEQLGCWFKIITQFKENEYSPGSNTIKDELINLAYRQAGLYYMRQRDYNQAVIMLQNAKDVSLLIEAYFKAEMYDDLRYLASTLSIEVNQAELLQVSKVLARIGDVEGSVMALIRINRPDEAIKTCISLKRFDKAIPIAQEYNLQELVDKHISEYLKQLLSSGDDKAALDLLRKTNQGEIAACIIIGAAMEDVKEAIDKRNFPLQPNMFNRLRRLVCLAAKEATEVQKRSLQKDLKTQQGGMLTVATTDQTLQNLASGQEEKTEDKVMDNQLFQRFGNKIKSVPMIWKIVKQTRFIVLASYMLYLNRPEQALFPAIEASGFYQKLIQTAGNIQNVVDEDYKMLQKIALPIAVLAALKVGDFELASQLLEVLESDENLPSVERDQLEQLAVDVFSKFPPNAEETGKQGQVCCEKCKSYLPKYCTLCQCGWQAQLCGRTGQPVQSKSKVQKCQMCQSVSSLGKNALAVCPMCHENYQ